MDHALVIGGTLFVGRHTVEELLDRGYEVTLFNRGESPNPFADRDGVEHVRGNRRDEDDVRAVADSVDYDVVIDCYGMFPEDVEVATDAFADADAYVFVSSGSVYDGRNVPMREDETPLLPCSEEQATDESMRTYGPRKAECDRICFAAAEEGVNAMVVRPMLVYGPHDYTERTDYWIDRVNRHDEVVVPGDGDNLLHRAFVEDVADALVTVAEDGDPGEAYNVADRDLVTLEESLERIAEALGTDVDVVTTSERELATADLEPTDFPLYVPYPGIASTEKLHDLGWDSTTLAEAYETTVDDHLDADRDGRELGPDREAEEAVIEFVRGE